MEKYGLSTRLNHPRSVELPAGNRPLIQPTYTSVKYVPSSDLPYWDQYIYGRVANPTVRQLELALADLQEREDCIVFGSGVAAVTNTFLSILKAGDHIISFREIYKPSRTFIKENLPRYGIDHTILALKDFSDLEATIRPGKTKLIHFESPTNPNLEIVNIEEIIRIARKHGVLISMDGTFAGLHQHTQFDVDLMIQSLTKFANGHGDVLAGSVAGKKGLIKSIREHCILLGATLDPNAASMIARGLKTYKIRFDKQTENAARIAAFLEGHPKVKLVRYPGSELARRQMADMGAVVSFEIDPTVAKDAPEFCHRLKLIQFSVSLGSTESIISPTELFFAADLSAKDREEMGLNAQSVRLSVGLEDVEDLIADLGAALI